MRNEKLGKVIDLESGRKLGYAEYGDQKGFPILYFHGFPGSRLDPIMLKGNEISKKVGVRLIAIDRPGMGLSTFKKKRTLLDWPSDVKALVNELDIDDYSLVGYSGGGPYALSCAYRLGKNVTKIGVICGMGPLDAPGMKEGTSSILLKPISPLRKLMIFGMRSQTKKDPDVFFSRAKFSEPDEKTMAIPEVKKRLMDSMKEGMIQGIKGTYQESNIYRSDWGFKLEEIPGRINLWHGENDLQVPVSVGRHVAEKIPDCIAEFKKNEGHLSLPYKNFQQILEKLIG